MQKTTIEGIWTLAPGQLVSIELEQALSLEVMSGRVWLTIEADSNDYWLSAEQGMDLPQDRHIVLEAGVDGCGFDIRPQWALPRIWSRPAYANSSSST